MPVSLQDAADFLGGLTGLGTLIIAYYLFKLTKRQRDDAWFQALNQLHDSFWDDEDFSFVRSCIASDSSYAPVETILRKRLQGRDQLTPEEYSTLERLDKFFNFLLRAKEVANELESHRDLWERIYFQYWLDTIIDAQRHHLWLYFMKHYRDNKPILSPSTPAEVLNRFEEQCAAKAPRGVA